MRYLLCSLLNSDTAEYSAPFLCKTKKMAQSDFADRINDAVGKSKTFDPADWSLMHIGFFDVSKGQIESVKAECLARGNDVVDDDVE